MNIILPILASVILVTAQALWKHAFSTQQISFTSGYLFSKDFILSILSPSFIGGAMLYLGATFLYIYLFNKYGFYSVQSLMVVASITLTFIISIFLFHESVSGIQILGFVALIVGVVLIYTK